MNKVNTSQRLNPSSYTPDKGPLRCTGERKRERERGGERVAAVHYLPQAGNACITQLTPSCPHSQPSIRKVLSQLDNLYLTHSGMFCHSVSLSQ